MMKKFVSRSIVFGLLVLPAFLGCSGGGGGAVATVPSAPSNLVAVAISSTGINLTWTDASDNEDGFKIERSEDGITYTQVGTAAANTVTYSDTGLVPTTTYDYRVRAYNSTGDSGYSNTASATTEAPSVVSLPSVTALYPAYGANWNDYVKGGNIASATDAACDAAVDTACLNGGELRKVVVTGKSSCVNLTAADDLGAFNWICDDGTGTAQFVSAGLKAGKYLSGLLDFSATAWRTNRVTVYDNGAAYGATPSTVWWSNPVIASNSGNDGSTMTAGDIYLIASNPTATFTFGASKVALVAKPGLLVTGSTTTGETLVSANGKDYLWFEGGLDAAGDTAGVFWQNVRYSSLRNVEVLNADAGLYMSGVWIEGGTHNTVRDVTTENTLSRGFMLSSSHYNDVRNVRCAKDAWLDLIGLSSSNDNYLENIVAVHSRQKGISLYQSSNNRLMNVIVNNNHSFGIDIESGSSGNVLQNVTAANNLGSGLRVYSPSLDNVIENVTAANNGNNGIDFFGVASGPQLGNPTNNLVMNAAAVNSNYGLYMSAGADANHFVNLALAGQSIGVFMDGISNTTCDGLLKVGNLISNCTVSGGTIPGLVDTSCANDGSSNATLTTGVTITASFAGKVLATDTANGSNTNGAAQFQDITDWLNFTTQLRMWGIDGSIFPDPSNRGYCGQGGATDGCRIYDWSLSSSDSEVRNVLPLPSGNDTITHTWSDASSVTFLKNAVEILDGSGNGDGLCESGETCLYTPNIGSYQGHGNLVSTGAFADGTLTGITLLMYEMNGR